MVEHNETPNNQKKRGSEPPNLGSRPVAHSDALEPLPTSALTVPCAEPGAGLAPVCGIAQQ